MKKVNVDYINKKLIEENISPLKLERITYPEVETIKVDDKEGLKGSNHEIIGTKGDMYHKQIFDKILQEGCFDINPRTKYIDGVTAHTLSINHGMTTYDLTKGESPLTTLRPIAIKKSIGEILWIYQDASNDLNLLRDKYGVTWWDDWDIGDRTIGATYGESVRRRNMMGNLLEEIKNNPDGRRHIISLWQVDDYKEKHGLKPCAFLTEWNVRHGRDGIDYLDLALTQRSSDFATAGCINQIQYLVLQHLVARHLNLTPGRFTWFYDNIQIYDRHIAQAIEMLNRTPINCSPRIELNPDKKDFYDFTVDDIKIVDYPMEKVKKLNPQLSFPLGI